MNETREIHDPFLNKTVEISSRLTDRLRGMYANGPTMPNGEPEFGWRQFDVPPIQKEAADRIEELGQALAELERRVEKSYRESEMAHLRAEIDRLTAMEMWQPAETLPEIKAGSQKEFIVAVRRQHSGKVYSFAASYLNAYPLEYRHECPKGDGCEGVGCEDGCPTTGWFIQTGEDDDSTQFHTLDLRDGDKFMGWRSVPQWPSEDVAGARLFNQ